jgi:flagellar motor protein MotB
LLDQVAAVLVNYKHITKIRIEGHTDSRGSKKKNTRLSQRRAEAVRDYVVGKGVSADRLAPQGYGPTKPIASNRSSRGREMNRRVEFVIMEQRPIGEEVKETEPEVEMELDMPMGGEEAAPVEAPPTGDTEEPAFEFDMDGGTPDAEPAKDAATKDAAKKAPKAKPKKKPKKKKKSKKKKSKKADEPAIEFEF